MSIREAKGREIADRLRIVKSDNLYLVPSQSGKGKYKVDANAGRCDCPDHEFTQAKCKHIFAVEVVVKRERKTTVKTDASGATTTTVKTTETVKVKRQTYPQQWPAYNMAQTNEKRLFLYLLHQLCQGVGSPAQHGRGQRRLPLEDMIFAMAYKVYSTVSGRRFMTDLKDAYGRGFISKLPCYNSIFNYFEDEMLTPHLQMLIEESSLPLTTIEEDFAVDSSGLSTGARLKWHDTKWGATHVAFGDTSRRPDRREWVKVHVCCGVKTNVVTAVEVTESNVGDAPVLPRLVKGTAENFVMRQVSADKAYASHSNFAAVIDSKAEAFIGFRSNHNGKTGSPLFRRMYHYFSYNQERFMRNYHKRSNVESTFHMIKAKFGDALRSKTKTAQINEALCKILCHNICVLIQSMHELNLKPKFYAVA